MDDLAGDSEENSVDFVRIFASSVDCLAVVGFSNSDSLHKLHSEALQRS
jgi:hypothetical protein